MSARICITGGIACGKSLVGGVLAGMGVPVVDADDVCHGLMTAGSGLHRRIAEEFGGEIVRADGELDRRALGRIVSRDRAKREKLNSLVHPAARAALEDWLAAAERRLQDGGRAGGKPCCVAAIIPLVFEAGWSGDWDSIVCVAAPEAMQVKRLRQRGLTESEAVAWIRAQLPVDEKIRRSDYVIFNSGSPECAESQTLKVLRDVSSLIFVCSTK